MKDLHYKTPNPFLPKTWEDPDSLTDPKDANKRKAIIANDLAFAAHNVAFNTNHLFFHPRNECCDETTYLEGLA